MSCSPSTPLLCPLALTGRAPRIAWSHWRSVWSMAIPFALCSGCALCLCEAISQGIISMADIVPAKKAVVQLGASHSRSIEIRGGVTAALLGAMHTLPLALWQTGNASVTAAQEEPALRCRRCVGFSSRQVFCAHRSRIFLPSTLSPWAPDYLDSMGRSIPNKSAASSGAFRPGWHLSRWTTQDYLALERWQ